MWIASYLHLVSNFSIKSDLLKKNHSVIHSFIFVLSIYLFIEFKGHNAHVEVSGKLAAVGSPFHYGGG